MSTMSRISVYMRIRVLRLRSSVLCGSLTPQAHLEKDFLQVE